MKNEDCTSAFGLWQRSKEFLEAALKVSSAPKSEIAELKSTISFPAYFLVSHSIELSLKAFLYGRGIPLKDLKKLRNFGHDLEKLLKEARKRKLGKEVKLSTRDCSLIQFLNQTYMYKDFEYHSCGYKSIPRYYELVNVASTLVNGLLPYCYEHTTGTKVNNPAWIREHSVSS